MRIILFAQLLLSLLIITTYANPSESTSLNKRGKHPPPIEPTANSPKPAPVPQHVQDWLLKKELRLAGPVNSTEGWIWNLAFDMNINTFEQHRKAQDIVELSAFTWSKDHCSSAPDKPFGFDFTLACNRHDFMYHAWSYVCRFDHDHRKSADEVFYEDMKRVCRKNLLCKGTAKTYYAAVRAFSGHGTNLCGNDKYWD